MKTCEYAGEVFPQLRSHPWVESTTDSAARYYDFKSAPHLIRSALEDFVPWAHYAAIETFYALLQRLNHERSLLETNDCELTGPHPSDEAAGQAAARPPFDKSSALKAFACSGRLMLLFRSLEENTVEASVAALRYALHVNLAERDAAFLWGVVGTTLVPTRYLALPEADGRQLGQQLMISFWARGDSEADTMLNLGRLFTNLSHALRKLSSRPSA